MTHVHKKRFPQMTETIRPNSQIVNSRLRFKMRFIFVYDANKRLRESNQGSLLYKTVVHHTPVFFPLLPTSKPLKDYKKLGICCKLYGVGHNPVYEIDPWAVLVRLGRGQVSQLFTAGGPTAQKVNKGSDSLFWSSSLGQLIRYEFGHMYSVI